MSLIRRLSLFFLLPFSPFLIGHPQASVRQIELQTLPSLDSVRPLSDLVKIVLRLSDGDGKPIDRARVEIRLYAPPPGRFFSTDFHIAEGARLIELDLLASQGRVDWEYVFPIRGVYRLEVGAMDGGGEKVSRVFALRVRENRIKLIYVGSFVVGLFLFGVIVGRLFTVRERGSYLTGGLLLVLSALSTVPAIGEPLMKRGGQEPLVQLEIGPPKTGQLTEIHWQLSERETGKLLPSRLTLSITHLEKGKRIFFVDRIPTTGNFALGFHFIDASPHRVSSIAEPEGSEPVRAEKIVTVTGKEPPPEVSLRALFFFLVVIGMGLLTGRISRRRKK